MKEFTAYHLLKNGFKGKFDEFRAYVNENNITHLNLSGKVKNENSKLIAEALKGTKITRVNLDSNKIGDQGAKDFMEALKDTEVTDLDLSQNEIGPQAAKDLGKFLKGTKVARINFCVNKIGDQGAKDFGEALKDTEVTDVDLSKNEIGPKGAKDFAESLKGTKVTRVNLSWNRIDDQDAKDLGEALKGTQVTHVRLAFNTIGVQGASDFALCIPYTLLLNVYIYTEWKPYLSEAIQSNIAKYIHTPYYLIALKLLPEEEKDKCKNIKKEALSTTKGQLRYACGILLHPLLPLEIFNHIYRLFPLASKKENIISTYLDWAKYYRLRNAFGELSFNVPYQPQQNKYILNQYRLQPKADLPVQPVFAETLNKRWKKSVLL